MPNLNLINENANTVFTSILAGQSAIQNGAVLDCGAPISQVVMVVVGTGVITAGTVQLQASLDGVNWYVAPGAINLTGPGVFACNINSDTNMYFSGSPFRFYRAAITTAITGGTVLVNLATSF